MMAIGEGGEQNDRRDSARVEDGDRRDRRDSARRERDASPTISPRSLRQIQAQLTEIKKEQGSQNTALRSNNWRLSNVEKERPISVFIIKPKEVPIAVLRQKMEEAFRILHRENLCSMINEYDRPYRMWLVAGELWPTVQKK